MLRRVLCCGDVLDGRCIAIDADEFNDVKVVWMFGSYSSAANELLALCEGHQKSKEWAVSGEALGGIIRQLVAANHPLQQWQVP